MNKKVEFALSILFFWVKGSVAVDSRFVKVNTANAILGIFPAGRDAETMPLKILVLRNFLVNIKSFQ